MTTVSHTESGTQEEWESSSAGETLDVRDTRMGIGARLADLFHAVVNRSAPVGYEDEGGFHNGEMPADSVEYKD
jgi:hypothetical protein